MRVCLPLIPPFQTDCTLMLVLLPCDMTDTMAGLKELTEINKLLPLMQRVDQVLSLTCTDEESRLLCRSDALQRYKYL